MPDDMRTRRVAIATATFAILVIAALAWRMRPPEAEASPPAAARQDATVVSADEGVERSGPGGWMAARAGDPLGVTDSIRTAAGSNAEILLGRGSHVTLQEGSEVTVRELTAAVYRVGVLRGRIGVDHRPDGTRVLRVEDQTGAVAASGSSGRFGVVAAGDALGVAAAEGQLTVESGGAAVQVPAGEETVARRGVAPLPPRPIPRGVVLRVARMLEERRASLCNVLQVDVASELTVNGVPVDIPADGNVPLRLPARLRARGAQVVVRHATGIVERHSLPCQEKEGAVSELEVRWNGR
jgi:ferric-dicitrate binding protein FerR (iron transport regulator)